MGRSRESYTVAELWEAVEDAYAAACPGWAWAGDPETLVANAKRFREGIERERDEWKERAEAAVGVRMGELERIRAERDALAATIRSLATLLRPYGDPERHRLTATQVKGFVGLLDNAQPNVGSAEGRAINVRGGPQLEFRIHVARALLDFFGGEDSFVTVAACDGHDGPGLYAWLSEYPDEGSVRIDRLEAEHADGGPS